MFLGKISRGIINEWKNEKLTVVLSISNLKMFSLTFGARSPNKIS